GSATRTMREEKCHPKFLRRGWTSERLSAAWYSGRSCWKRGLVSSRSFRKSTVAVVPVRKVLKRCKLALRSSVTRVRVPASALALGVMLFRCVSSPDSVGGCEHGQVGEWEAARHLRFALTDKRRRVNELRRHDDGVPACLDNPCSPRLNEPKNDRSHDWRSRGIDHGGVLSHQRAERLG